MDTIKIIYNRERQKLVIYRNDKLVAGMVGKIAEERFNAIKREYEMADIIKTINYGHKAKTPKV